MNINDLTIGQAKELAAMFGASVSAPAQHPFVGRYCICRCTGAGVHAGEVGAGRRRLARRLGDAQLHERRRRAGDRTLALRHRLAIVPIALAVVLWVIMSVL